MHRRHDRRERSTDVRTSEGRSKIVFGTWELLAPIAYRAYQQHGRGALVLAGDKTGPDKPPFPYLMLDGSPDTDPGLVDMIEHYDPEREIVVVFQLRDFHNAVGRYQAEDEQLTPGAIHRSQLAHGA